MNAPSMSPHQHAHWADSHGFVLKLRAIPHLNGSIEGIHVHMHNHPLQLASALQLTSKLVHLSRGSKHVELHFTGLHTSVTLDSQGWDCCSHTHLMKGWHIPAPLARASVMMYLSLCFLQMVLSDLLFLLHQLGNALVHLLLFLQLILIELGALRTRWW